MKHFNLLKSLLLLCALIVGSLSGWADDQVSTMNFTAKCNGSGTANDNAKWTVTSDGTESNFDSTYGIHYGTNNAAVTYVQLTTSDISGTVKQVVVNARDAQATATISVTVGGSAYTCSGSTTATNSSANYTFTGSGSGAIVVRVDRGASLKKAIYVKSVAVTYSSGPVDLGANDLKWSESVCNLVLGSSPYSFPSLTNAKTLDVAYDSSDKAVATISDAGVVSVLAAGSTTISANFAGNTSYNAKTVNYTLNVSAEVVHVTGVTLDIISNTLAIGETLMLTPTIAPIDATDKDVTWESNDEEVATVDGGVVTAKKTGTAIITVKTVDGNKTATCAVTVIAPKGSVENPYTVAEARAKIDEGTDLVGKAVTGIVSQVDNYNETYNSIQYWISDDGTTVNQMEVYGGLKSEENSNGAFSSKDDIQIGDVVTVYGTLKKYNSTYELDKNNYLVSLHRKDDSDLTITSSSTVSMELTSSIPSPTSTITWTTTSIGIMSFSSDAETVVVVSDAGVITAVGAGTATITIRQAADDIYKASEVKEVTVTVEDNRSFVATGIDLTSPKILSKGDLDDFVATSTKTEGFTGSIVYTYESSNSSILNVATGTYSADGVGAVTVTITATPVGGNAICYKQATQEIPVVVNGINSISLSSKEENVDYSDGAFNITVEVPTENYNGTVSAESSNTAVATVSVEGTTITITPVAVGTSAITVTAGAGTYYPVSASDECVVTIVKPTGSAVAAESVVFATLNFGNNAFSLPTSSSSSAANYSDGNYTINISDATSYYYFQSSALFMGKEGATLTLPAFDKKVNRIDVVGKSGASGKVTQNIYVDDEAVSTQTTGATTTNTYVINESYQTIGTIYKLKVTNANNTQITAINVYTPNTISAKLNAYGYATFCSEYPLDFSEATGYTAWQVKGTSGSEITFEKITGSVKGGTGIFLMGEANATVTLKSADSDNVLSSNMLTGTLAPTYVTTVNGDYTNFGLSGDKFVKINNGTVKANKAYLPILTSNVPGAGARFNLVFENETDGIKTINKAQMSKDGYFDLQGRKVAQPTKGLYIVNGKKVVKK